MLVFGEIFQKLCHLQGTPTTVPYLAPLPECWSYSGFDLAPWISLLSSRWDTCCALALFCPSLSSGVLCFGGQPSSELASTVAGEKAAGHPASWASSNSYCRCPVLVSRCSPGTSFGTLAIGRLQTLRTVAEGERWQNGKAGSLKDKPISHSHFEQLTCRKADIC